MLEGSLSCIHKIYLRKQTPSYYYLQVPKERQEYAMAMTSLADAIGISLSGLLAIPLHNQICKIPK